MFPFLPYSFILKRKKGCKAGLRQRIKINDYAHTSNGLLHTCITIQTNFEPLRSCVHSMQVRPTHAYAHAIDM